MGGGGGGGGVGGGVNFDKESKSKKNVFGEGVGDWAGGGGYLGQQPA